MIFNEKTLKDFLDDKPFFESAKCYCLGNTLREAGEIIKQEVISASRGTGDVGMADKTNSKSSEYTRA